MSPTNEANPLHNAPPSDLRVLVLATYNEGPNLKGLIPAVREFLPDALVVVVDDNSPDGTPEWLREQAEAWPGLHPLVRHDRRGYGSAMLEGLRVALDLGADRVATLDADFSHDPKDLPRLFDALEACDVAIGSRYSGGVRVLNWHPSRLLLSLFANRYVNFILRLQVHDATSGFRAYRRGAVEQCVQYPPRSKGYSFLVELLYGLHVRGCRLTEVPIIYSERREGQSKMSKGVILEAVFRPWMLRFGFRR